MLVPECSVLYMQNVAIIVFGAMQHVAMVVVGVSVRCYAPW